MTVNENSKAFRTAMLAAQLAQEKQFSAHMCAVDAIELHKLAATAERWAVLQCNGIEGYDAKAGRLVARWTEGDQTACDKAKSRIEAKANVLLEAYGAKVLTVSGDPPGCVMRLSLASGATNGFGEGWGL